MQNPQAANSVFVELSALPVVELPNGSVVLTRKFVEGMKRYVERWPGPVVAVMDPTETVTSNLDNEEFRSSDLPFGIEALPFRSPELRRYITTCGFVHWGPHHQIHDLGEILKRHGIPNVYCTEYSLRTRLQVVRETTSNPVVRWRRTFWEWQQERRMRRNVAQASGFEANGTPTFESYKALNHNHLLFFDTRMTEAMMASSETLRARSERLEFAREPLHLVFSGRLVEMKGALDLVRVAEELSRRKLDFRMSICGAGHLETEMQRRIDASGLSNAVAMRGVLPFEDALVPFVSEQADLFVSCHKQGDPSCTYLETFGCGVPIAGYRNEAFAGLLQRVDAGWGVDIDDVKGLADLIGQLSRNRRPLIEKSRHALEFARQHTFESTFERRVAFFLASMQRSITDRAAPTP